MEETGAIDIDVASLPRIKPRPYEQMDEEARAIWDESDRSSPGSESLIALWMWNPELARVRTPFVQYVKNSTCLPLRHREYSILRTAWKTGTDYIWARHSDIGHGYGITDEEIERVAAGPDDPGWTPEEAAVLRAIDELCDHCRISDATWAALAAMYDEAQLLELVNLVATYHIMAFTMSAVGMRPPYGDGTSPDLPGNRFLFAKDRRA
jgi:alkylhydroperoxidase family enzyme